MYKSFPFPLNHRKFLYYISHYQYASMKMKMLLQKNKENLELKKKERYANNKCSLETIL